MDYGKTVLENVICDRKALIEALYFIKFGLAYGLVNKEEILEIINGTLAQVEA